MCNLDCAYCFYLEREPYIDVPDSQTPWQRIYRETVGQLADGAVVNPAVTYAAIASSPPRHSH